jgi:Putative zinc-finger
MDHSQATQSTVVEKYLLDELAPEEREQFEEHFFDCQECAVDLRATDAFITAAKHELAINPVAKTGIETSNKRAPFSSWPSTVAWFALAASLLVMAYQNVMVFPNLRNQVAELRAPEILPSLSLVGGNSRGGQLPAAEISATRPFLLQVDIPTQDRFSSYTCLWYSPTGTLSWRTEVSAQAAKDTVLIRVPSSGGAAGVYTLAVQGNMDRGGTPVDLAHYRFTLKGDE